MTTLQSWTASRQIHEQQPQTDLDKPTKPHSILPARGGDKVVEDSRVGGDGGGDERALQTPQNQVGSNKAQQLRVLAKLAAEKDRGTEEHCQVD